MAATVRTLPVPSSGLRIEVDEPGSRLILTGPEPTGLGCVALMAAAVFLVVSIPTVGSSLLDLLFGTDTSGHALRRMAMSTFIPTLAVVLFLFVILRVRQIRRLAVDGLARQIEIVEVRAFGSGRETRTVVAFSDLQSLSVSAASQTGGQASRAVSRGLKVTLKLSTGRGAARQFQFSVAGLDRKEEGGDLALRLAAAAGFTHHHVVRSDTREIEIEFARHAAEHFTPMPTTLGRADYDADRVPEAAQAVAATEETPPFDPASFKGDHRIAVWKPWMEVRFRKPMGLGAIGCSPAILLLLAGPVYLTWALGNPQVDRASMIAGAATFGFIGLLVGGIALLVVKSSLARTVLFDWVERRVQIKTLATRTYSFSELRAVELKCVRTTGKGGGSCYCRLILQVASRTEEPTSIEILWTEFYRYDPDTPYRMALPLATDLAKALGVPRIVTDYR